jgi:hypothetical protein
VQKVKLNLIFSSTYNAFSCFLILHFTHSSEHFLLFYESEDSSDHTTHLPNYKELPSGSFTVPRLQGPSSKTKFVQRGLPGDLRMYDYLDTQNSHRPLKSVYHAISTHACAVVQ